ncbi:MAG: LytR C-terminal domain-containing protein [Bifidobacteriaceae bacterium]|nr:LytR C-terminal domain-containing protein [Bifidobacteriaceae bacterium]
MANYRRAKTREKSTIYKRATISLSIVFAISLVIVSGVFDAFFTKTIAKESYDLPCITPSPDKAEDYGNIHLRVLNASYHAGLGQAVNLAFAQRGFSAHGYDNYDGSNQNFTKIVFGANSVKAAYTLSLIFPNVVLKMDNRTDELIDVIIGNDFTNLKPDSDESQNSTISSPPNCKDVSEIQKDPAPEHKQYNSNKVSDSSDADSQSTEDLDSSSSGGTGQ